MIRYYQEAGVLQADEERLITEMKPWYDGYCFAKRSIYADPKMFNCDMVTYYLNSFIQNGCAPEEMIDRNTSMDYAKLDNLIRLDQLDGYRQSRQFLPGRPADRPGNVQEPAVLLRDADLYRRLRHRAGTGHSQQQCPQAILRVLVARVPNPASR